MKTYLTARRCCVHDGGEEMVSAVNERSLLERVVDREGERSGLLVCEIVVVKMGGTVK